MTGRPSLRQALAAPPLPADFAATVVRAAAVRRARHSGRLLMPLAAAAAIAGLVVEALSRNAAPPPASVSLVAVVTPPAARKPVDPAWSYSCIARGRAVRIAAPAHRATPPPRRSIRALRAALHGADTGQRELAAVSLAARNDDDARNALVDALALPIAAPTAAAALVAAGGRDAAAPIRRALAVVLERPQAGEVVPLLPSGSRGVACHYDGGHAAALIDAVADCGDTAAVELLLQALRRPRLRAVAHSALVRVTGVDRGSQVWRWRCWLAGRTRTG